MTDPLYGVYGASGFGREVMPLARAQFDTRGLSPERLVFIDDGATMSVVNGHPVLSYDEFMSVDASDRNVTIAVGNSATRATLAAKLVADRIVAWSVRASSAVVMDAVEIGEGAILSPFVTLTSNIRIGRHFHGNIYSYVAHDCEIGEFVTFAPGVHCNGNVTIHDYAYVGAGAILRNGRPGRPLTVGRGATIGMGAVVTKDVSDGSIVIGNPARSLQPKVG